jgi:hypothetical protein
VRKEGIWSICNSTKNCTPAHIQLLKERGLFQVYSSNMELEADCDLIKTILESLEEILKIGNSGIPGEFNRYQKELEVAGIVEKLENLQLHSNRRVYEGAVGLIERYFLVADPI